MKTVDLEDDVYHYIASQTREIGEPATSILRRLLGMPLRLSDRNAVAGAPPHELAELLVMPMFSSATTAVARMLRIFKEVHGQKSSEFERVLQIQGRNRAYFARSARDILKSGKSTQPRQIPGTDFWVMTNSPTPQKQQMVREVLELLGYSELAVREVVAVVR